MKIARITEDKQLLLAGEVLEGNSKVSVGGTGNLKIDEIREYPNSVGFKAGFSSGERHNVEVQGNSLVLAKHEIVNVEPTSFQFNDDFSGGELDGILPSSIGLELWKADIYGAFDEGFNFNKRITGGIIEPELNCEAFLRPKEGKFGGALWICEGTTNLVDSSAYKLNSNNNAKYPIQDEVYGEHRRVRRNPNFNDYPSDALSCYTTTFYDAIAGKAYTNSLKVKPEKDVNLKISSSASYVFCPAGEWTTLFYTTTQDETTSVRATGLRGSGFNENFNPWIEYKDFQVEEKPFFTGYTENNRQDGYIVYNPIELGLNKNGGTVALWCTDPKGTGVRGLITIGDYNNNRIGIYKNGDDLRVYSSGSYDGNEKLWAGYGLLVMVWDLDSIRVYVNGELITERQHDPHSYEMEYFALGNRYSDKWSAPANSLFDDVIILPYAVTEQTINVWVEQGLSLRQRKKGSCITFLPLCSIGEAKTSKINWNDPIENDLYEEFNDPVESSASWIIGKHGGNGTVNFVNGECIMMPEQDIINSVSIRKKGNYKSVKVRAKLVPDSQNNSVRYFDVSIGNGAVVDIDDAGQEKWWHTTVAYGYVLYTQTEGSETGMGLRRMDGPDVDKITLGNIPALEDWTSQYHDYELQIHENGVRVLIDGEIKADFEDVTYKSGDVFIAQGEYSNGSGAIAHIEKVEAAIVETSVEVESSLSFDSGESWSSWQTCTNGGPIPDLENKDLASAKLRLRYTLETTDTEATPILESVSLSVQGEKTITTSVYHEEGYWVTEEIDLSEVEKLVSNEIDWVETIPQNTDVVVETSLDKGSSWQTAISGSSVSGISQNTNFEGVKLLIRASLKTNDVEVTPILHRLKFVVMLDTSEKPFRIVGNTLYVPEFIENVDLGGD